MSETRSRKEITDIIRNTKLSPEDEADYNRLFNEFKQKVEELIPDATIYSKYPIGPGVYHSGYNLSMDIKLYDCLKRLGIESREKRREANELNCMVHTTILPIARELLNNPERVQATMECLERDDGTCALYPLVDVFAEINKKCLAEYDKEPYKNYIIIYKDGVWYM